MDLSIELAEAQEMGRPVEQVSANYARGALPYLTPKLTQLLTQQDDDGDNEEWSPAKAAGVCLMNMGEAFTIDVFFKMGPWFSKICSVPTEPISTNNSSFKSL